MTSDTWTERGTQLSRCGRRVAWREGGTGPALVYLHDAGADTVTAPAFDDLARDHRVLLVDLPGYGRTERAADLQSPGEMADLVSELLTTAGATPAVVTGTSLGGWFAAELAAAHPEHVTALVLADAAGLHAPHSYLFALFAAGAAAEATHHLVAEALLARLAVAERPAPDCPPALAAALVGPWVQNLAAAAAMSWSPTEANPVMLARLRSIRCPTVVLWGEADALIPLSHGRTFAATIPGARLEVVAGAGHLVVLERPDAFVAAVRSLSWPGRGSVALDATARHDPGRPGGGPRAGPCPA